MTMDKINKILGQDASTHLILGQIDQVNAIQIAKQALAYVVIVRNSPGNNPDYLLPGETKE